jgi:NAD-dependent dihydropyrimidine dehydrogenase PreA subunit
MAIIVDKDKCTGCGTCVDVCPVNAISVNDVATINEEECVECGSCIDECPNEALSMSE